MKKFVEMTFVKHVKELYIYQNAEYSYTLVKISNSPGNVCIALFVIFMILTMAMIEYIEKNYKAFLKETHSFKGLFKRNQKSKGVPRYKNHHIVTQRFQFALITAPHGDPTIKLKKNLCGILLLVQFCYILVLRNCLTLGFISSHTYMSLM